MTDNDNNGNGATAPKNPITGLIEFLNGIMKGFKLPTLPGMPQQESQLWKDHTWNGWVISGGKNSNVLTPNEGDANGNLTEERTNITLTRSTDAPYKLDYSVTFSYKSVINIFYIFKNLSTGKISKLKFNLHKISECYKGFYLQSYPDATQEELNTYGDEIIQYYVEMGFNEDNTNIIGKGTLSTANDTIIQQIYSDNTIDTNGRVIMEENNLEFYNSQCDIYDEPLVLGDTYIIKGSEVEFIRKEN